MSHWNSLWVSAPTQNIVFLCRKLLSQLLHEKVSVVIIIKHFSTTYSPGNNVVKRSWSIYAGFSWYEGTISNEKNQNEIYNLTNIPVSRNLIAVF